MPAFFQPAAADLTLSVQSIEHPALAASGVRLEIGKKALLHIGKLKVAGREFGAVRAECADYAWQGGRFECPSGLLALPGFRDRVPFRLTYGAGRLDMELRPARDERWHLVREKGGALRLAIGNGRLERLRKLLSLSPDWTLAGRLTGDLTLQKDTLRGRLRLTDGSFSDPAGLHAGDKIALAAEFGARRGASAWLWQADLGWQGGEAFWQPAYAKAQGQALAARGRLDDKALTLDSARLDLPGIGAVAARGQWDRAAGKLLSGSLESAGIDLGAGAQALLNPLLAQGSVPEVDMQGRLSFSLGWDREGLAVASLGLDDVAVRDKAGRFAAEGIFGGLPWLRQAKSEGYLAVGAARAADFKLGAFRLPIAVAPDSFSVPRTEIPLLGSELVIDHLAWRRPAGAPAWEGDLGLSLQPVTLLDLTRSFGLPAMTGTLSASFPHLRYRDGSAFLDGALVIQVFDGYLNCTRLRLEDPFGPLPRLTADVEARHIDLGQLTETFSFGRIEGFADAEIRGLELVDWRPQAFDAKVMSSPGRYRKRISQRAVQNISSLGGAGAGAALQATFLRIFEEFGYDRIGISCRLRAGVCEMGGIEEASRGYVMVKGGGIPALTVIGYNRHVDWQELVDRIKGIIHDNVRPVIR